MLHGVEQMGGGRKVKLGGLFAEEEGGLFALGIIIFHLQRNNSRLSPFDKTW